MWGALSIWRALSTMGDEGLFRCSSCGWRYEYILFGDRVAIYAEEGPLRS
jgi:hypothetical protein